MNEASTNASFEHDWLPLLFWVIASPMLVLFWAGVALLAWELC